MTDSSSEVDAVLRLLRDRHNVLISGPPGTGKSRLLGKVANAFVGTPDGRPVHVPGAKIPIPRGAPNAEPSADGIPGAGKTNRKVFRTVFHQNSKYREFVAGLIPTVGSKAVSETAFRVVAGVLYRASEHARSSDGAALIIIDEINRGPAVQVFGGSIVAIESDKRLGTDGKARPETQYFEILDPASGDLIEYALPHDLYLLAAMNQADTSVEPLDVAFLRRWTPFRLEPSPRVLREFFGLPVEPSGALPVSADSALDVLDAAARAWEAINKRIRLGRGAEFQLGHGVLMTRTAAALTREDALTDVAESWRSIRVHIDEVFFGDVRGVAAVLNVASFDSHLYALLDSTFADEPRLELIGPEVIRTDQIYDLLRAVVG